MTKELKDKWIAALRSGQYKQGHTYLHKNDEFCCLGVLLEVADIKMGEHEEFGNTYHFIVDESDKDIQIVSCLPGKLQKTLGLGGGYHELLWQMNDGIGVAANNRQSFTEIAQYIEQNIPTD